MFLRRIGLPAFVAAASLAFVPATASAYMCDLTTVNSVCGPTSGTGSITVSGSGYVSVDGTYTAGPGWSAPNNTLFDQGAIFAQINVQPTGTGVIDSFLRLQNSPTEQGYNTDARDYKMNGTYSTSGVKTQFDEKSDATFTHSIQLSDVPTVTINGKTYREFFLDINENAADPGRLLSLDQLEIYVSNSSMLDNYTWGVPSGTPSSLTGPGGATSTLIYSLDTGFSPSSPDNPFVDNWIKLDYLTSSGGSGKGDMVFFLPDALFTMGGNPYIYLYSQFGCGGDNINCPTTTKYTSDDTSNAGFEEWWVKVNGGGGGTSSTPVPEPTGLVLLGTGLVLAGKRLRKPRKLQKSAD